MSCHNPNQSPGWFQLLHNRAKDISGEILLSLDPLGKPFHQPGELRKPGHLFSANIININLPEKREEVVFTEGGKRD